MSSLVSRVLAEPPLSASQEHALARAAAAGDAAARDALVRSGLRLVALRVRALGLREAQVDDAFQAGALGLLAAVARFDPDRGVRLATYAWPWITAGVRGTLVRPLADPVDDVPEPRREAAADTAAQAETLLDGLAPAERRVLELRHGIGAEGGEPRTWREVARTLGTTPAAARRTGDRAMSRLRAGVATVGDRAPHVGADPP